MSQRDWLKMRDYLFAVLFSIVLISCGGTTHRLGAGTFEGGRRYVVKSYFGCCGCKAKYFTLSSGRVEESQVIWNYNCPGGSDNKVTKFVFETDKKGKIIAADRYVGTENNDVVFHLSDEEKRIFESVDTRGNWKRLKGFRKPKDGEKFHPFPIVRKSQKVTVR